MTFEDFIIEINDELSQDCQLPFKLHKKSVARIVKLAKKWFYTHYEYAVEEQYVMVPKKAFQTEEFLRTRHIKMDKPIIQIYRCQKANSHSLGDFSIDRLNAHRLYTENQGHIGTKDLSLTHFVANQVMYDWVNRLFTHEISYNYNFLTQNLTIVGEIPNDDVILQCDGAIPDEALFEDEYFFRYCVAYAKKNLARILGTIRMPLVGKAEIDFDSLRTEGSEELQEVKEEIEKQEGVDFFFEK